MQKNKLMIFAGLYTLGIIAICIQFLVMSFFALAAVGSKANLLAPVIIIFLIISLILLFVFSIMAFMNSEKTRIWLHISYFPITLYLLIVSITAGLRPDYYIPIFALITTIIFWILIYFYIKKGSEKEDLNLSIPMNIFHILLMVLLPVILLSQIFNLVSVITNFDMVKIIVALLSLISYLFLFYNVSFPRELPFKYTVWSIFLIVLMYILSNVRTFSFQGIINGIISSFVHILALLGWYDLYVLPSCALVYIFLWKIYSKKH